MDNKNHMTDTTKQKMVLVRAGEGTPTIKVQTAHEVADLTATEIAEIIVQYNERFPEAGIAKDNMQVINWTREDEK